MKCEKCGKKKDEFEFAVGEKVCMACVVAKMDEPKPKPKMTAAQRKKANLKHTREWRKRNPEKHREYQKTYYKKINGARSKARFEAPLRWCNGCRARIPKEEFSLITETTWYQTCDKCRANKKTKVEQSREWREKNPEKAKATAKAYNQKYYAKFGNTQRSSEASTKASRKYHDKNRDNPEYLQRRKEARKRYRLKQKAQEANA